MQMEILLALGSRPETRLWRQQAGRVRTCNAHRHCPRCRYLQLAPAGASDLVGLHRGQFLGVEVKSAVGRQSKEQSAFERMVRTQGGIYVLARSVTEAIAAIP